MSTPRTRHLLLALVAVALLALGGVACSGDGGDDDDATTTTSTTEAPSTEEEPTTTEGGSTTTEGDSPTTDAAPPSTDGDGATTTTTEISDNQRDLASRIPAIEGYEREVDYDDAGFDDELCDGSSSSVVPVEEVSVDFQPADDGVEELLAIGAAQHASEDEASSFYDEFTSTTGGCTTEGLTVSEGTDADIGDESLSFEITYGQGGGALYVARQGDEVWFLSHLTVSGDVPDDIVDAFRTAVEG